MMVWPLLSVALHAWSATSVGRGSNVLHASLQTRRNTVITGSAEKSDAERQKYLSALFGNDASRIAKEATNIKTAGADVVWVGADGAQLEWGDSVVAEEETCSIDRDVGCMPLQPTMISLQPLLPNTKLFCYRLDMPLGMLIEEDAPVSHKAMVAPVVRSFVGESCAEDAETCDASQAYAGGILAGDIVRATSYVTMGMKHEVRPCRDICHAPC